MAHPGSTLHNSGPSSNLADRQWSHRVVRKGAVYSCPPAFGDEPGETSRAGDATGSGRLRIRDHGHYVTGPGGTGKSHLAQAIGQAVILQGHKVLYRQTHILLEEVGEATLDGKRKQYMESISGVALLIIDDFGMRKLPQTAAEDLLEIVMRRYERASTLLTSNRLCGAPHKRFNAESIFMRRDRP
jgi:IstB-like ATP binding protein